MRKPPLKRRELIALLEHNGFISLGSKGGSHVRYAGKVDGKTRFVDVDSAIDEFSADHHSVLYYIVSGQLQFFGDEIAPPKEGWARFYAGEPSVAKKAGVNYRKWDSK